MVVDLPSSPLAEVDPEFEKMALETAGYTFALTGTSVREKLLQNLTQDICHSQLGLAFRMHVTAAMNYAIPYPDLLATVRFVAPYSGYPAAADALARLKQVAVEIGMDVGDLGQPSATAGGKPDQNIEATDDWMKDFLNSRIARAWSEDRLTRRERTIIAITSDIAQQTLDDSFGLHVTLALDAGLSENDVRDVVRFCAEHGVFRSAAAMRELEMVLAAYHN